ncbi:interleukin-4 receptor subunit alpha isoform X2 [Lynx rufus]|uniref:interleukin-4 receptor subunit alpha isoform X2 n=1 Tax=Lynx rufus TaxID=61384 RepID=UPI001F12343B|nr:interleukin-4 receptor subunit alpha isoform X2 [Lynx rufus]XP_046943566.1 interleukin-4 receptor subunit alpha isoform X2 [Lynx rufus]XP_046943567.1 interleukin-4 receptor subunit alpha isoform X2 [Lynx rufus]XP_046943568.1 interleukin-4 receptor subunit alpha isoform X2 [Lynx rufus]XP_046943569.1 interleukin-4 receptor subunit alpha isoform X2 [Lynx rufus]
MGRLCSGLTFPVSYLILVWAAGSGSVKVLRAPTCFSDYFSTSVCQWNMDAPTNCSAELRLSYQLNFMGSENRTCVPENGGGAACACSMLMDDLVDADVYQLHLWAGTQLLWSGSFKPSSHVKPRAPGNLTVHPNVSHTWLLRWSNPYPPENHLHAELTYMVNISSEDDPTDSRIYNVTYVGPTLRVAASTLKSGASYSARVRAWAQSYNSTWSEWSPSTKWLNRNGIPDRPGVLLRVARVRLRSQISPRDVQLNTAETNVHTVFQSGRTRLHCNQQCKRDPLSPHPRQHPLLPESLTLPILTDYEPWEQHLPLGVSISCLVILAVCLSCYLSVIKIKKEWWDQIPNPAHSHLVAIVIQDPQVSLWGKRSRGQEPAKCPHWKTCLRKLLPCLLEHGIERKEDPSKIARNGPSQGSGKSAWCPVEVSKTILWPESISVVRCVELLEAPVESEEEEEEEDKGSFCPSPVNREDSFQEGREGIAARLTESLFLDLLGVEKGGFGPQGSLESWFPPPSGSAGAQMPWAEFPGPGPQEASPQGKEQPFDPRSDPLATLPQSPASPTLPETPPVVTDNPAYRSFGTFQGQSSGPGECGSGPELAGRLGEADPGLPAAPQPSEPPSALQPEPETWEQILRQRVLQHRGAPAPAPGSGYREFVCAVRQGSTQDSGVGGFGPSEEAGYKAFSSLLTGGAVCPETSGGEAGSGDGGYKPFQSLTPGCPGAPAPVPVPLFTFGLDAEPPHCPQDSPLPGSSPEPAGKAQDSHKTPPAPEQAADPLRDDLASGIVYSALTCHLCGHLKQCHGQEEGGEAHPVASPCCGCCCGDRSSPLVSPLRAPDPLPGGVPLEASLSPASPAPLAVSEEGPSSLCFQSAPSHAHSSSQTPKKVAMLSPEPTCTMAS